MKVYSVKREWTNPIIYLKKHYCPYCSEKLTRITIDTIIDSESEEARNYDFSNGASFIVGKVRLIRTAFRCNKCDRSYTTKEVKENDFAIERWK